MMYYIFYSKCLSSEFDDYSQEISYKYSILSKRLLLLENEFINSQMISFLPFIDLLFLQFAPGNENNLNLEYSKFQSNKEIFALNPWKSSKIKTHTILHVESRGVLHLGIRNNLNLQVSINFIAIISDNNDIVSLNPISFELAPLWQGVIDINFVAIKEGVCQIKGIKVQIKGKPEIENLFIEENGTGLSVQNVL